jgi:hypothetical protein
MVTAKMTLKRAEDRWRVNDTVIIYDESECERLGPMDQVMEYEEAIKEAKRWVMLRINSKNRRETEDDITWDIDPILPVRHISKL